MSLGASLKREASIKRIREVPADYARFTDGSASEGIFEGSSEVVATKEDAESHEVIHTLRKNGLNILAHMKKKLTVC